MKRIPFNENYFADDTERSFYWAGLLAADGCLQDRIQHFKNSKSHRKEISIHSIDKELIETFMSDLEASKLKLGCKLYKVQNGYNTIFSCKLSSQQMFDHLLRFGLTPRKSKTLQMPLWLQNHPLVNHFIRGYFDGDGSIYLSCTKTNASKTIEFRGTVKFLQALNSIIKNGACVKTRADVHIHSDCGSLKYCGNTLVPKIAEYMYKDATIFLDRKHKRFYG